MKKRIIAILVVVILCGCTRVTSTNLKTVLNQQIEDVLQSTFNFKSNVQKKYFSYYLNRDLKKGYSNDMNFVVSLNNVNIVGSINANDVVVYHRATDELYQSNKLSAYLKASRDAFDKITEDFSNSYGSTLNLALKLEGTYLDNNFKTEVPYIVYVHRLNTNEYLVNVKMGVTRLSSIATLEQLPNIVHNIFMLGKSIKIAETDIVVAYDISYIANNKAKGIDLGIEVIDENGYLMDHVEEE